MASTHATGRLARTIRARTCRRTKPKITTTRLLIEELEPRYAPALIPIATFNGGLGTSSSSTGLSPYRLTTDSSGNAFLSDYAYIYSHFSTVFEVEHGSSTIKTLAAFDGFHNVSPLTVDSYGNLFGTTNGGGAFGDGTVFEVARGSSTITTLASFDGANGNSPDPSGALVMDSNGNLFGTTSYGGASNDGTVFDIPYGSTTITTIATFNGANGNEPGELLAGQFLPVPPMPDSLDNLNWDEVSSDARDLLDRHGTDDGRFLPAARSLAGADQFTWDECFAQMAGVTEQIAVDE